MWEKKYKVTYFQRSKVRYLQKKKKLTKIKMQICSIVCITD